MTTTGNGTAAGTCTTPEVSLDERKQKHVSFDASSLMRSQTIATMDESTYNRTQAATSAPGQAETLPPGSTLAPAHSSERLISDGSKSDFAYYSELLPPDLARQLMLGMKFPVLTAPASLTFKPKQAPEHPGPI